MVVGTITPVPSTSSRELKSLSMAMKCQQENRDETNEVLQMFANNAPHANSNMQLL